MSTAFPYDDDTYTPSAPIVEVKVFVPGKPRKERVIHALIDTGADNTIVPLTLLNALKAPYLETYRMRGITGTAQSVDLFGVSMEIGGHLIRGVHAIGINTNEPILGRDILNRLVLILDGPNETLEIPIESE